MNFYLATYDYGNEAEERVSVKDFETREQATEGLSLWRDEYGAGSACRCYVKCVLDDEDWEQLDKVPSCERMIEILREAGPETVREAARLNSFTSLFSAMGATDELGRLIPGRPLLWERATMYGPSLERALVYCASCVFDPSNEFLSRHFIESYRYLPGDLRECVIEAMRFM